MPDKTILEEAAIIISGPRRESYGDVLTSFTRIARLWSPILGMPISPQQVAACMIQLKVAREMNSHSRDNLVDICGYAALLEELNK